VRRYVVEPLHVQGLIADNLRVVPTKIPAGVETLIVDRCTVRVGDTSLLGLNTAHRG
jgi:hypothetical protein